MATPKVWATDILVTNRAEGGSVTALANGNLLVVWGRNYEIEGGGTATAFDGQIVDPLGRPVGAPFSVARAGSFDTVVGVQPFALPDGGFVVSYQSYYVYSMENPTNHVRGFSATGRALDAHLDSVDLLTSFAAVDQDSALVSYWDDTANTTVFKTFNPTTNALSAGFGGVDGKVVDSVALQSGQYLAALQVYEPGEDRIQLLRVDAEGKTVVSKLISPAEADGFGDFNASVTQLTNGDIVLAFDRYAIGSGGSSQLRILIFDSALNWKSTKILGGSNIAGDVTALADGTFVVGVVTGDDTLLRHYSETGQYLGQTPSPASDFAALADGRLATVMRGTENPGTGVFLEFLDTRDNANPTPVYGPKSWQVGTIDDDVFSASAKIAHGWNGNDTITEKARAGANVIYGDAGNDIVKVTTALDDDIFSGGAGIDTIDFSAVRLAGLNINLSTGWVSKGRTNERILSFEGAIGTTAADTLTGGYGVDTLTGKGGNDSFRYVSVTDSRTRGTADTIRDFDDFGNDKIDLSLVFRGKLAFIGDDAFTNSGQVRINNIAGVDLLVEVNTGGSLAPDMVIRLHNTSAFTMAADDFVL